jgi:hypothetical protein
MHAFAVGFLVGLAMLAILLLAAWRGWGAPERPDE